jgi:hypothetical protein
VLYIPVERDRLLAQGRAMSAEEAAGYALDLSEAGGPEAGG